MKWGDHKFERKDRIPSERFRRGVLVYPLMLIIISGTVSIVAFLSSKSLKVSILVGFEAWLGMAVFIWGFLMCYDRMGMEMRKFKFLCTSLWNKHKLEKIEELRR